MSSRGNHNSRNNAGSRGRGGRGRGRGTRGRGRGGASGPVTDPDARVHRSTASRGGRGTRSTTGSARSSRHNSEAPNSTALTATSSAAVQANPPAAGSGYLSQPMGSDMAAQVLQAMGYTPATALSLAPAQAQSAQTHQVRVSLNLGSDNLVRPQALGVGAQLPIMSIQFRQSMVSDFANIARENQQAGQAGVVYFVTVNNSTGAAVFFTRGS